MIIEDLKIAFVCDIARQVYGNGELLSYQTDGSSGIDPVSITEFGSSQKQMLSSDKGGAKSIGGTFIKNYTLKSGSRVLVGGGIRMSFSKGFEVQIRSRSGLSWKHGVMVLNSPGTIDSDYRGEVGAILINTSDKDYVITKGERVAQMVFCPIAIANMSFIDTLDSTERGEGGFGSTGKK
jgi:dUTP pyrophosphatase